jgi:phosphatidate cytidylyltransferase
MIYYLYLIILLLFVLGGIFIYSFHRKKTKEEYKKGITKFWGYFVIVQIVILSILIKNGFCVITYIIVLASFVEIVRVSIHTKRYKTGVYVIITFILIGIPFLKFGQLESKIVLFTYIIIALFDALCQISGQKFGRIKLAPKISPNKTWEGLIGGLSGTLLISLSLIPFFQFSIGKTILLSLIISVFAFIGDLLESYSKRCFNIIDYSTILPGQGGFLDRFDSFIFTGSILYFIFYFQSI